MANHATSLLFFSFFFFWSPSLNVPSTFFKCPQVFFKPLEASVYPSKLQALQHFSASLGGSRWMWHRLVDLAILIWRTLLTY
ncbi:hypothetical protein B0H11DRAFT_1992688 [Mycena galericulata]|nr:hypothetical protein B0H11DRAFT_1992688 [Mycena galericulata]